jgi:hypothetical protein
MTFPIRFTRISGILIGLAALAGAISAVPVQAGTAAATTTFGSCHVRGTGAYVLPDPRCTPGAVNPVVTQATIHRTICVSGWTATVRPSSSYTSRLKVQQMYLYGDRGSPSLYEEDHFIPLELGGSPASAKNLWPEYGRIPNPKDAVENAAKRAVCGGRMSLVAAQRAMVANWITFGRQLHAIR